MISPDYMVDCRNNPGQRKRDRNKIESLFIKSKYKGKIRAMRDLTAIRDGISADQDFFR